MGVVRRMGDWRLEKRDAGVYEVTFQREPQERILTPDAPPYEREGPLFDIMPVKHVQSYSEAEGLFEERAHGPPPLGMEYSSDANRRRSTSEEDIVWSELPAGLLGITLVIVSLLVVYIYIGTGHTIGLAIGVIMGVVGLMPFAYASYLVRAQGWRDGFSVLTTPVEDLLSDGSSDGQSGSTSSVSEQERTPPPPESLKNELFFERAERHCEYCEKEFDQLHIHHITPRREGGPNDPANLIVLCPNCHSKADSGTISRSKLRYTVNKQAAKSI